MSNRLQAELRNSLFILAGSLLLAVGVALFLAPNRIATGGTPGMAILLHFVIDLPVGVLMAAINVPLLILGAGLLGRAFVIRTLVAILLTSGLTDLLGTWSGVVEIGGNQLLATLYGGIGVGLGVGLILRGNGSAGGSTIIARVVSSRSAIKPGQVIFFVDLCIVLTSALVFRSIEPALWSLISIFVTAKCIDAVLSGTPTEKIVHIATARAADVSEQIAAKLGRHGTVLTGTGLSPDEKRSIVFVTVELRRITLLREIIRVADPEAFMVVMDASELLGRGHGR